MAFIIPNKNSALLSSNAQAIGNKVDTDVIAAGIGRADCVLDGLVCSVQTGANQMKIAVTKGSVITNKIIKAVAAITGASGVTISTRHTSLDRIDAIVVNSSGTIAVRTGTAATTPLAPTLTANDVCIAFLFVLNDPDATGFDFVSTDLIDKRVFCSLGAVGIYSSTADETTNTTASAINILDKTNSGVSIPNGLFLTGRKIRGRIGGTLLINGIATTMTVTLEFIYGGTTMWKGTSAALSTTSNDTDRRAFDIDFILSSNGTSTQRLNGKCSISSFTAAITTPTTGVGPGFDLLASNWPISGTAAVNADTANRTLQVQWTFSVSSANNEIVVQTSSLEII